MSNHLPTIDLTQSCKLYSQSVLNVMKSLFDVDLLYSPDVQASNSLIRKEEIYFSILFTGQVYGEFIIGLNKDTALSFLGFSSLDYERYRDQVIDSFKEIINIAAGSTLRDLKRSFPELSITPPKAIEGTINLSNYSIYSNQLSHASGNMSCYIYVDYMKLEVAEALIQGLQKREELNRLNKAKSEFLANMSHELRTPLNGMIGMLDLLRTTKLTETQREQLGIICNSGDFLLTIINDILEFSKIEQGKIEVEHREFDLVTAIETVADALATEIFRKDLDFHVYLDPRLRGRVHGDETRIKQVITNLIGNAAKFTPTGSISLELLRKGPGEVEIAVLDTGIGIPKAKLASIFDSFSQADLSDNRRYGRSGLGLTISKSLVTAMGGEIRVESEEAKGSRFSITLPLKVEPVRSELDIAIEFLGNVQVIASSPQLCESVLSYLNTDNAANARDHVIIDFKMWKRMSDTERSELAQSLRFESANTVFLIRPQEMTEVARIKEAFGSHTIRFAALPLSYSRLVRSLLPELQEANEANATFEMSDLGTSADEFRVLLVEDNQINQRVASAMLTKLGLAHVVASNGQEAVDLVRQEKFDLVLMDCQMPVLNGYEATQMIRSFETGLKSFTPIVAMIANAFKETKERCFESGMNDFVSKPIKTEGLRDVIQRVREKFGK